MTDLVKFLRARLDEDREAARAATSETGHWTWDHGLGEQCNEPECPYGSLLDQAAKGETYAGTVLMDVHGYDVKAPWQGAAHIARHDPARVLREVEAKRQVVNYESDGHLRGLHIDAWGIWRDQLKSLAAVYADHPDYREEWRP